MELTPIQSYYAAYYLLDRLTTFPSTRYINAPGEYVSYFAPMCEWGALIADDNQPLDCRSCDPAYLADWYRFLSQVIQRLSPADIEQQHACLRITPEQMLAALVMHLYEYTHFHFVGLETLMEDINHERVNKQQDTEFWQLVRECCERAKQRLGDDYMPSERCFPPVS